MFNKEQLSAQLSIFDSRRNLVYNEALSKELIIQKVYDLSKLATGSYNVALKIDGKKFTKTVVVK